MDPHPMLSAALIFVFGLLMGSFLNVVVHRLPRRESIVFPGSRCASCGARIKPYDNIPVISYVLLRGRCRNCRKPISPVYPSVELLVAILYLAAFYLRGWTLELAADLVFISLVVPLVFIDLRHKLLPNAITYPGFAAVILMRIIAPDERALSWLSGFSAPAEQPDWLLSLAACGIGALVGGGSLWLVREAYWRLRKVEGMGLGDVKMMFMVGAYLGWQRTLLTIFIASLLGSVVGVLLIRLRGGSMKMEIPFGVFLGPGALIGLLVGYELLDWYTGFYS